MVDIGQGLSDLGHFLQDIQSTLHRQVGGVLCTTDSLFRRRGGSLHHISGRPAWHLGFPNALVWSCPVKCRYRHYLFWYAWWIWLFRKISWPLLFRRLHTRWRNRWCWYFLTPGPKRLFCRRPRSRLYIFHWHFLDRRWRYWNLLREPRVGVG